MEGVGAKFQTPGRHSQLKSQVMAGKPRIQIPKRLDHRPLNGDVTVLFVLLAVRAKTVIQQVLHLTRPLLHLPPYIVVSSEMDQAKKNLYIYSFSLFRGVLSTINKNRSQKSEPL